MKRSNRLLILLGIVLAVIAFGAVLLLTQGPRGTTDSTTSPTPRPVTALVATQAIPLGTTVTEAMVTKKTFSGADVGIVPGDYLRDASQVNGLIMRSDVLSGDVITASDFNAVTTTSNADLVRRLKKGFRAMAVQVDQVTGVGTLIQPGDHVDVVLSMEGTDKKFPVVEEVARTQEGQPPQVVRNFKAYAPELLNATSIKVLVQNATVVGVEFPPPPTQTNTQTQSSPTPAPSAAQPGGAGTSLNGQQELAILALTPQQVELVRFAQLDGNLSLVLRSTADADSPPDATTGVTLSVLVSKYQVLPGQLILQNPPPSP
ncbi:MAG TPA: Flp pilus assembly protein CpaB [Candidatus Limnocylindrales bacterium]|nr:Flp pilus assembly protein CpaB [Candidatus Limnocylindrales bacterium]